MGNYHKPPFFPFPKSQCVIDQIIERIIIMSFCITLSSLSSQTVIRNIYPNTPNIGSTFCQFYLSTPDVNPNMETARSLDLYFCDNISFDLYYPGRVPHL
jgi:hypothetical protein